MGEKGKFWPWSHEKKVKKSYRGLVTAFQQSSQGGNVPRQVWNFTLHQEDDTQGNKLPEIPVHMWGIRLDGYFTDGDFVQIDVKEEWKEGEMLEITKLHNITRNIDVEAHHGTIT